MKPLKIIALSMALSLLSGVLCSCEIDNVPRGFTQITQDEAKEMMARDDGHILVDVRRVDEYEAGHIPGAICIPNESIGTEKPEELPDLDQIILIYCRTGRRSKEAAQKLAEIGYTRVCEFGGINDWTGDIVMKNESALLRFDSFDGGGPEYELQLDDPTLVEYSASREYAKENHEELDGAGYTITFAFTGIKPGETILKVIESSPLTDTGETFYRVTVDEDLTVSVTSIDKEVEAMRPRAKLVVSVGGSVFYATLADTDAARELAENLNSGSIALDLAEYGGFEKVGALPWSLPRDDAPVRTAPGDLMLYQGDQLVLFYGEHTWDYTPLAKIYVSSADAFKAVLGNEGVRVTLSLEWSE